MDSLSRRECLRGIATLVAGAGATLSARRGLAQAHGDRPLQMEGVEVLNPRNRVPLSFIIDDSTCLVNLAYYGIPQFGMVFPERYTQPWKTLPREIPDSFVRKFAQWCDAHDVKGKYSIVPYPACVGWLDRFLPGWSKQELKESLDLVRTMLPRLAKRAGITKRVHAHGFRHTHAYELMMEGVPMGIIQQQLGPVLATFGSGVMDPPVRHRGEDPAEPGHVAPLPAAAQPHRRPRRAGRGQPARPVRPRAPTRRPIGA